MKTRKIIVEFHTPAGDKRLDGIEVKFSVEKIMSAVMNKADISICNLAKEDIEYLTAYTSQFLEIEKRKRIRLFAGYEEDGVSLIFDGDIVEARPTSPPDKWLRIKALSGYYSNKEHISQTINGDISVKELCGQVASILGLSMVYEATTQKKVSDFAFTGDRYKLIKELNELGDIEVWEEDGNLHILDSKMPRKYLSVRQISENSGLISLPKPDAIGMECKLLLDNSLRLGQQVYLDSKIYPSANGQYYIYHIKHTGDLRGKDFYTEIQTRRIEYANS